jgi:chaperonin GroES
VYYWHGIVAKQFDYNQRRNRKMTVKIRPLHNRVIIKRKDEENTSAGGIVLPDSAAEKPMQGVVMAVGGGKKLDSGDLMPMDLQVGDNVLFGKYAGTEVKVNGEDLMVMTEDDVMGVVE